MAGHNPQIGLFKEILDLIHLHGVTQIYDTDWITDQLLASNYWGKDAPPTPKRTVNSYFSTNPNHFVRVGSKRYRLSLTAVRPSEIIAHVDDVANAPAPKVLTTVFRTLRDTQLIRQLKVIHADQCQICGEALAVGGRAYSEGHHIRPLSEDGPDVAGNILILCPNHHVLCDYRAIELNPAKIRTKPGHVIDLQFLDWHNQRMS